LPLFILVLFDMERDGGEVDHFPGYPANALESENGIRVAGQGAVLEGRLARNDRG
jgi:hypothetical protein